MAITPVYSLKKPTVGGSQNTWGQDLNENFDAIDTAIAAAQNQINRQWLDDVVTLLSDTTLTYTSAQPGTVLAGDIVRTRAEGFSYRVAASGATDHHVTPAGGVKLYVLPGTDGAYHTAAFGANWRKAFEVANALATTGLASHIFHPGAAVVLDAGSYTFDGAGPIDVVCNVEDRGAEVNVPADYAGIVWRVGKVTAGDLLATADIALPNTNKPTGTSPLVGTAYRVVNANACRIKFGRADWFDRTYHFGGIGQGTVYCELFLGQTSYANAIHYIVPGAGGWFNANNLYGGNFRLGGYREAGKYFVYADGAAPATAIVGNNFFGPSYEALGAEFSVYGKNFYGNTWYSPYVEHGFYGDINVTVSGSTLTSSAHGLVVNDLVSFAATSLPGGMSDAVPYYVVAATVDTFQVAISRGGAAITFSTAGSGLRVFRQSRWLFDGTSGLAIDNRIVNRFSPPSNYVDVQQTGLAENNGEDGTRAVIRERFEPDNFPLYRARNTSSGATSRPIFAAYPPAVNPATSPLGWSAALSDRGMLFGGSGAETGRLWESFGTLQWQPAGQATAQIPTGFRPASLTTLGSTVVPANGRAIVTITVTGAAVGDYVIPYTQSALVDGIAIAFARVSAASTVQFCFHNWTGSPIDINGTQIKAMVLRNVF
jgi:hypothetical protein